MTLGHKGPHKIKDMKLKKLFSLLLIVTLLSSLSVYAQNVKVVTGHPDFKIKINRCEAAGSTVVIDMVFENVGSRDVAPVFFGGSRHIVAGPNRDTSFAYDDDGNKYTGSNDFKFAIGKSDLTGFEIKETLPAEIPIKARIQLDGVPESATMIKRIDFFIDCPSWNLNLNKPIKITNLPIYREGED